MAKPPLFSVTGLSVQRNNKILLDQLDWTVGHGENWAVLGPNGSGKTSLLRAIVGYLTPTSGRIELMGQVYGESEWPPLRKRIGMVSSSLGQDIPAEEPALMTVVSGRYAMIDFWGRITRHDREKAAALLRTAGCWELAERPWRFLSQGERQKVLILRALMADPEWLILDEPCAGLDPVARETFLQFMEGLAVSNARKRPTLLLVTHHIEEITAGFEKVILLRGGRVVASGRKTSVLKKKTLEETFGASPDLRRRNGRYAMSFALPPRRGAWKSGL